MFLAKRIIVVPSELALDKQFFRAVRQLRVCKSCVFFVHRNVQVIVSILEYKQLFVNIYDW